MRERTVKTIWIGKEAYFYLFNVKLKTEGCAPLTERQKERIWDRKPSQDNMVQVDDDSFAVQKPTGGWIAWSTETLKEMLTEAGFEFEDGVDHKVITVTM